ALREERHADRTWLPSRLRGTQLGARGTWPSDFLLESSPASWLWPDLLGEAIHSGRGLRGFYADAFLLRKGRARRTDAAGCMAARGVWQAVPVERVPALGPPVRRAERAACPPVPRGACARLDGARAVSTARPASGRRPRW